MNKLQSIIQQLGQNFTAQEFYDESRIRALNAPSVILDEMYRVGVLGNHYSSGEKKDNGAFFIEMIRYQILLKPLKFIGHYMMR